MAEPLDTPEMLVVWAIFLLAAVAKGVTGLGFSTTCLPFLALSVGLHRGLGLLILPSLASNFFVLLGTGELIRAVRRFWPLLLAALPGVGVGLWLLGTSGREVPGAVLGVVLIGYAGFALWRPDLRLAPRLERPLAPVAGFATGVVNGLTGSQVMPVLPYLMALHLAPALMLATINISFTLSSLVMAAGLSRLGLLDVQGLAVSAAGVPVVWLGVRLGAGLRRRLPQERFRQAVLAMLAALGAGLMARLLL